MARKLTLVVAALAAALSYGMSTHAVQANDKKKACFAQCQKTTVGGKGLAKCVNNCMAAK